MSCVVFVEGHAVEALVGVYAHEQGGPQPLIFDVEAGLSVAEPDALSQTLDYDRIVAAVAAVLGEGHIVLIEQAASRVARRVLAFGGVDFVRVRVRKPRALDPTGSGAAGTAGCEITLKR